MTGFSDDGARLHMAVRTDGDRTTLTLTGELDLFSGPPLAQLLDTAMNGNIKHLDMQMAQVDFVDVDGVRLLMHAHQLGASRGVTLTLHDPQPVVGWLLHITGTALLLGDSTAPADNAMLYTVGPPPPVRTGEPVGKTPSVPLAGITSDRDLRADDRDRLADERDRLVDERQRRVSDHQRWEDIREDVADARERNLERRENER